MNPDDNKTPDQLDEQVRRGPLPFEDSGTTAAPTTSVTDTSTQTTADESATVGIPTPDALANGSTPPPGPEVTGPSLPSEGEVKDFEQKASTESTFTPSMGGGTPPSDKVELSDPTKKSNRKFILGALLAIVVVVAGGAFALLSSGVFFQEGRFDIRQRAAEPAGRPNEGITNLNDGHNNGPYDCNGGTLTCSVAKSFGVVWRYICDGNVPICLSNEDKGMEDASSHWRMRVLKTDPGCGKTIQVDVFDGNPATCTNGSCAAHAWIVYYTGDCPQPTPPPCELVLEPSNVSVKVNETVEIKGTYNLGQTGTESVFNPDGVATIQWGQGGPINATQGQAIGTITGVAPGSATYVATHQGADKVSSCQASVVVNVVPDEAPVCVISFEPDIIEMIKGETAAIKTIITKSNGEITQSPVETIDPTGAISTQWELISSTETADEYRTTITAITEGSVLYTATPTIVGPDGQTDTCTANVDITISRPIQGGMCVATRIYTQQNGEWVVTPIADLPNQVKVGDTIRVATGGRDRVFELARFRFRVSGGEFDEWLETTTTNDVGEFYITYTIPSGGTFSVEAQLQ